MRLCASRLPNAPQGLAEPGIGGLAQINALLSQQRLRVQAMHLEETY